MVPRLSPQPLRTRLTSRRLLLLVGLLAAIGFGIYTLSLNFWGWYHLRAAEYDLAHRRVAEALRSVWPGSSLVTSQGRPACGVPGR